MAKFEHQQFEEWLLSDETLTGDQSQALNEHLLTCEGCQQLLAGLQGIEHKLNSAPIISPRAWFRGTLANSVDGRSPAPGKAPGIRFSRFIFSWRCLFLYDAGIFGLARYPVAIPLAAGNSGTDYICICNG